MTRRQIDFKALADAALARAETLLAAWLPGGKRAGHEYQAANPTRADAHLGSFSINVATGAWADFATNDRGGDLVSLYAYLFHNGDQGAAAKALTEELSLPGIAPSYRSRKTSPAPAPAVTAPGETTDAPPPDAICVLPVPDDAPPPPKAHPVRGLPETIWTYRDAAGKTLGHVCRFRASDGGKEIIPLTYWRNAKTDKAEWKWRTFPEPRPLYGLDRLAAHPDATVLTVEGEKCVDAAQPELPHLVLITWPGGAGAVDKADWKPLIGRNLITFADADSQRQKCTKAELAAGIDPASKPWLLPEDQPGHKAMAKIRGKLAGHCRIWNIPVPAPGEAPDGHDIADMIAAGTKGAALADWIRQHAQPWSPPATEAGAGEKKKARPKTKDEDIIAGFIYKKGDIASHFSNAVLIFQQHPALKNVLAFDMFSQRRVKRVLPPWGGELGNWTDADCIEAALWMSRHYGENGFLPSSAMVDEAATLAAMANVFHPVRIWLENLHWDGVPRLSCWLSDFMGAPQTIYTSLAGQWWLMGAVARVLSPGCKFDYCLVLQGPQGAGKSTAFSVLGGPWFGDGELELSNKDVFLQIGGKLIYEIAELGAFARADALRQKSFLSRREDEWRPHYGRGLMKVPRQVVFGGTTNETDWNKDLTGGRRFWPVECREAINLDALSTMREQLFAEAHHRVKVGEKYWPSAQEQREYFDQEQAFIQAPDAFVDLLWDWCHKQVAPFTLVDAAIECMELDASKLTADMQRRIGMALTKICGPKVHSSRGKSGVPRFTYKPPVTER